MNYQISVLEVLTVPTRYHSRWGGEDRTRIDDPTGGTGTIGPTEWWYSIRSVVLLFPLSVLIGRRKLSCWDFYVCSEELG